MPARPKFDKNLVATIKQEAFKLGVLARAVNAVENCLTETNRKENVRDSDYLREMIRKEAEKIYVAWHGMVNPDKILSIINKTLDNAGWDYTTFCVNHDADDGYLLTWHAEE
jgi:lysophospholipid acyltransferase (LPLAT)-like uncharacterized protein